MDFNVYAGDDVDSSLICRSSDGYFASKVLRSGLLGGVMHKPPPPNSGREAIEREILKERIREEILARDMLERRILEEEVRREIEMERIMEARRLHMEMRSGLSGTSGVVKHGDRQAQTFMPTWVETGIAASLRRGFVKDDAEFTFRERSSSHQLKKKTMTVMAQAAVPHEAPSNVTATANCKLSGAKRKAQGEFLIPAEKQWGCALCKVSSSSEEALKDHLQGKKHKAKEALLSFSNNKNGTLQNVSLPEGGPVKKKPLEGKKQQRFWCGICKVKCNSAIMMEYHYSGKRHKNSMELKKSINNLKIEETKIVANEQVGIPEREGFIEEELEIAHQPVVP